MLEINSLACCKRAIDLITIYKGNLVFQCKQCGKIYMVKLKKVN